MDSETEPDDSLGGIASGSVLSVVREARYQSITSDERSSSDYRHQLLEQVASQLDVPTTAFRRWKTNFIADFYLIDHPDGPLLLKTVVGKPAATAEVQFRALTELREIATAHGSFTVPDPIVSFSGHGAYVMCLLEGQPLSEDLVSRTMSLDIVGFARSCGRALAAIHASWSRPLDIRDNVVSMVEDLASHSPWRLRAEDLATVRSVADVPGEGCALGTSRLYLDYDVVNVLVQPQRPALIDPPEDEVTGLMHWDLGTFLLGLERTMWKRPLLARSRADQIGRARDGFLRSYASERALELQPADHLLVVLSETIRLAQLAWWWRNAHKYRDRFRGYARSIYVMPFVRAARRRRMDQLDAFLDRV